jgi:aryl-phospho-beta-D-glucosidase BglC (GH1 family)
MGMVDGLWAGGSEAATDFALIAYQLRLLGYNAVRLPFTWRDLEAPPRNLDKECSAISVEALKRRLISPHVLSQYESKPLPGNTSPQRKRKAGYCNQYLPRGSNYDRLLFVMQSLIAQGMYVVLDYQPMVRACAAWAAASKPPAGKGNEGHHPSQRAGLHVGMHVTGALPMLANTSHLPLQNLEHTPYDLAAFISSWGKLWQMVACLPNFQQDLANRVFVDVMNEPDSMSIAWEARGGRPGAQQLYLGTADRLWSLTPNSVLFMFEGA